MPATARTLSSGNRKSPPIIEGADIKYPSLNYRGDLKPQATYEALNKFGGILVDVRTMPEWQFVGTPDVSATHGSIAAISWKIYPSMQTNVEFIKQLALLETNKQTPLYFICRSGGRSLDAAVAASNAGYTQCYNVEGGFEGEPDQTGHRGTNDGWKAAGLPWKQG